MPVSTGEYRVVLLSTAYFFLLLMSYYLLRPMRETFGISRGVDKLPLIWSYTLGFMALINPLYSALVARWPRRVFIPATYQCFAVMLVGFGLLYQWLPGHGGTVLGYTFYIWLSVFNLFVVSIFWAFMSDLYSKENGQRLFGLIAIGGTLGAIVGAWITGKFSTWLGSEHSHLLFYISAAVLELTILCVMVLFKTHKAPDNSTIKISAEPGPSVTTGLTLLCKSRLLQSVSLYTLLYALTSTFLYIFQGRVVEQTFTSSATRTAAFAKIDLWSNVLTLAAQLFFTHRLIARVGIPVALTILPFMTLLGFGFLWLWPGFAALAVFQVMRRGLHYAVDRPVREMLYIPLTPDTKYKAKSFIDTFVYRAGDFIGIWITPLIQAISLSLGMLSLGISTLWLGSAVWLGKLVRKKIKTLDDPEAV
ncbi:MAG: MFS transporter [Holophagales bacterium]|nr:MFS transporter [Holophagales bacterium]